MSSGHFLFTWGGGLLVAIASGGCSVLKHFVVLFRYQELDVAKTLKENLKLKLVIEYPLLHIVLKDHCHDYPLKGPGNNKHTNHTDSKLQVGNPSSLLESFNVTFR